MSKENKKCCVWQKGMCRVLYFWPLIVMGGRMITRMVLNVWNLIEPGGN